MPFQETDKYIGNVSAWLEAGRKFGYLDFFLQNRPAEINELLRKAVMIALYWNNNDIKLEEAKKEAELIIDQL